MKAQVYIITSLFLILLSCTDDKYNAQGDDMGKVKGKVVDDKNVLLQGVKIYSMQDDKTISVDYTDSKGEYEIGLVEGSYKFSFNKKSYRKQEKKLDLENGKTKTLDIQLEINQNPTDIILSKYEIGEHEVNRNTEIKLTTKDKDTEDTHKYRLVKGDGSDDNDMFSINGDKLINTEVLDYEKKSSLSIRVEVEDNWGAILTKKINIQVEDKPFKMTKVKDNAGWRSRSSFGAAVYNDKIWILGGDNDYVYSSYFGDVYNSQGGLSWTKVKEDNNKFFGKRSDFPALVYDDKIWVMGGYDNSTGSRSYYNDVWSSQDGLNWTKVKDNNDKFRPSWSKRYMFLSLVYDDKIWVMGGIKERTDYNDVWSSQDGLNWTEVKDDNAKGWNDRSGFSGVVFKNKMWVIGGETQTPGLDREYHNDVWSSQDGLNWTKVKDDNDQGWLGRRSLNAVVYNNKIWVMGGSYYKSNNFSYNDIWNSQDGLNWTKVKDNNDKGWKKRADFGALVMDSKIWIVGGRYNYSRLYNDVWYMED